MTASRQRSPGLRADVEVLYDRVGVPHIRAGALLDAYHAQGHVTAEARLFQLDLFRRTAGGRLAEWFGARALAGDRFQRTLGLARLAARRTAELSPPAAERLAAYACGVNHAAAATPLPLEYDVLGVGFEPWSITDSLLCVELRAILNASWRADLVRFEALVRAGAVRAADLFLHYELRDGAGETVRRGDDEPTVLAEALAVVRQSEDALRLVGLQHSDFGSNTWVADGRLTRSGRPLLANDLHMGFVVPNPNFLVHLQAPGLHVRGISFPGVPGVLTGHNERIAWGSTACMADAQDIFIEELDDDGRHYRCGHTWLPVERRDEEIRVRHGASETLAIRQTRHGPLIRSRGRWGLALQWERLECPAGDPSLHALNTARDWTTFRGALRDCPLPPTDFTYADVDGNVGTQTAGRVPIRRGGDGSLPAPGADGAYDWIGVIPFDDLPCSYRPANGYVVRSNQNPGACGRGRPLSRRWHPPYRARRVAELIEADAGRHTVESFAAIQFDRCYGHGRFLVPRLLTATAVVDGTPIAQAMARLRDWDGQLRPDSAAAAVAKECAAILKARLLTPVLGKSLLFAYQQNWPISNLVVEWILGNEEARWLPEKVASYAELYREVVRTAVDNLRKTFDSDDVDDWRWGALNVARFAHPLGRSAPDRFAVPAVEVGADGECPFSARSVADYISTQQTAMLGEADGRSAIFGAAARMVWDLADWDNSSLLLNLGQSGDPRSPHYADQLERWQRGAVQRIAFSADRVERDCVRRVRLVATDDRVRQAG